MLKPTLLTTLFATAMLTAPLSTLAEESPFQRYEQAKINLNYQGEVGTLLQKLAERLNVGFISYNVDAAQSIQIRNHNNANEVQQTIQQIKQQLPDVNIYFEQLGNRTFLVLSSGNEPLLGSQAQPQQYIGQAVFVEPQPVENHIEVILDADNPSATKESNSPTQENPEPQAGNEQNNPSNSEPTTAVPVTPEQEQRIAQIKRLDEIINEANESNLEPTYKNKVIPSYSIASKNQLGLDKVQATKIATFLLFDKDIDTSKFSLKSKHEEVIQLDNILAIVHKKERAPQQISLQNEKKQSLVLKAVKR